MDEDIILDCFLYCNVDLPGFYKPATYIVIEQAGFLKDLLSLCIWIKILEAFLSFKHTHVDKKNYDY